jgi:hypothetical protein
MGADVSVSCVWEVAGLPSPIARSTAKVMVPALAS